MEFLILVIAISIGSLVALFIFKQVSRGLAGAAGMVDGISSCGCGSLFLGIVVIVVVSALVGFIAGKI